jgi:hypothetical protein
MVTDSGQQPHPRNMENEIDCLDRKIMGMIGILSSTLNLSEGWYHGPEGIELILQKVLVTEKFKTATKEMVKERIEKLERMVKDYHVSKQRNPYHSPKLVLILGPFPTDPFFRRNDDQVCPIRTVCFMCSTMLVVNIMRLPPRVHQVMGKELPLFRKNWKHLPLKEHVQRVLIWLCV